MSENTYDQLTNVTVVGGFARESRLKHNIVGIQAKTAVHRGNGSVLEIFSSTLPKRVIYA